MTTGLFYLVLLVSFFVIERRVPIIPVVLGLASARIGYYYPAIEWLPAAFASSCSIRLWPGGNGSVISQHAVSSSGSRLPRSVQEDGPDRFGNAETHALQSEG